MLNTAAGCTPHRRATTATRKNSPAWAGSTLLPANPISVAGNTRPAVNGSPVAVFNGESSNAHRHAFSQKNPASAAKIAGSVR